MEGRAKQRRQKLLPFALLLAALLLGLMSDWLVAKYYAANPKALWLYEFPFVAGLIAFLIGAVWLFVRMVRWLFRL